MCLHSLLALLLRAPLELEMPPPPTAPVCAASSHKPVRSDCGTCEVEMGGGLALHGAPGCCGAGQHAVASWHEAQSRSLVGGLGAALLFTEARSLPLT